MKSEFLHCKWMVVTTAFTLAVSWTDHGYADAPEGRYTIRNGTVLDTKTKLEWQQTISGTLYTWDAANTYCSNLIANGMGWRVPSMKELQTLVDRRRTDPAIDSTAFPNTPSKIFWTSSPLAGSPFYAWSVYFYEGSTVAYDAGGLFHVRCVR